MPAHVREAPAPDPLHCGVDGPSHPAVEKEPVLNVDNIQGNILAGFSKDHQTLLFLKIGDPSLFKQWLKEMTPRIATLAEVITFNRLFKSMRARMGQDPTLPPTNLKVTWTNIAFSYAALQQLDAVTADEDFTDEAFKSGLFGQSKAGVLGDPIDDPNADGNPDRWLIGSPTTNTAVDVLVIVAGDDRHDVHSAVQDILASLGGAAVPVGFNNTGREEGENLPADLGLAGHEHFGFLDGVSQPGVRGRLSKDPHDVLTPRQNANNREQGKPGQELIWPGAFVFGYPAGEANPDDDPTKPFKDPGPIASAGPAWANDGSFLVFRRLRQKVSTFHQFLKDTAAEVQLAGAPSVTPDLVGGRLVGRWRSGAPIVRTANDRPDLNDADDPNLAQDDCANNNFEFQEGADPLPRTALHDPFDCTDANPNPPPSLFPPAVKDATGRVCPFTGHIRKSYPRDDQTLLGVDANGNNPSPDNKFIRLGNGIVRTVEPDPETDPPEGEPILLNENDTQTHRILRRGIPFGPVLKANDGTVSTPANPLPDDGVDRGLHFLCYQTSIENQFEFITKNWVNNPDFKEPQGPAPTQPPTALAPVDQGGGHDPVIGQNNNAGENRVRQFTVTLKDANGKRKAVRVDTRDANGNGLEWVIPTGGGYFFAPSIRALRERLSQ